MNLNIFHKKMQNAGYGNNVEVNFADLAQLQNTGKIGAKASFLDYFRKAKRQHRNINPIAANQADIVDWVLYDRDVFAAGTNPVNNFKFFTRPIGQNNSSGTAKTKVDTNMDQVQRLPDPQWFNTVGVGFYFNSNVVKADIDNFLTSYYMEFWVGSKVYAEGPIQCFPGAAGLGGVTTQTSESTYTNGLARTNNFFDLRLPAGIHLGTNSENAAIITDGLMGVTILQGQQFKVEMNAPTGGTGAYLANNATPTPGVGMTIMCYLYGILSRGVQ